MDSCPSLRTSSITLSSKPVTISDRVTVYTALVNAVLTIVARLTHYNSSFKNKTYGCYTHYKNEFNI